VTEHKNAMNKSDVRMIPVFFAQQFEVARDDKTKDWSRVRVEILHRILKDFGTI
jgi:hypothetical protein